ncbi:MAG: YggT family protein [Candidatus Latescibacteria bacterium]|nr:YggT family protein [Candidatus Latescibacterota bacterium]
MIVASNFMIALGQLLKTVAGLYMIVVIASAVITWFPVHQWHPAVRILRGLTDPVYERIRRYLPDLLWNTGIDFTPIIVLLALYFLSAAIFQSLIDVGVGLRMR